MKITLTPRQEGRANRLFDRAAALQVKFWEAVSELEDYLGDGVEIDATLDFGDYDLGHFIDEHNADEEDDEEPTIVTCHLEGGHGRDPHVENHNCVNPTPVPKAGQ